MTKRLSAKYKTDRRFGENIWGRPKSPVNKRQYGPGQHGQRRKGKVSDFGAQLVAKQKLRFAEAPVTIIYTDYSIAKGQRLSNSVRILEDLFMERLTR